MIDLDVHAFFFENPLSCATWYIIVNIDSDGRPTFNVGVCACDMVLQIKSTTIRNRVNARNFMNPSLSFHHSKPPF